MDLSILEYMEYLMGKGVTNGLEKIILKMFKIFTNIKL